MTKEDYMKLTKERLAELLAERDLKDMTLSQPHSVPYTPQFPTGTPLCPYGGACVNKFRDCVNCPGPIYDGTFEIKTGTSSNINENGECEIK